MKAVSSRCYLDISSNYVVALLVFKFYWFPNMWVFCYSKRAFLWTNITCRQIFKRWPSTWSNFWSGEMALLFRFPPCFDIGCMLSESPLGSFGLVHIIFGLKLATTSLEGIGLTKFATFMRLIQRSTSLKCTIHYKFNGSFCFLFKEPPHSV